MASVVRYAFRDGKLYYFHYGVLDIARAWGSRAGSWRLHLEQGWRVSLPLDFRVATARTWCRPSQRSQSAACEQRAAAMRPFLDSFPPAALRAVAPLRESNWSLLQLLNRCGDPAYDLLASTPALALLLACRRRVIHDARLDRLEAVRRALAQKQTWLLERFGFPPRPASARILRKIPRSALTLTTLRYLRVCLWQPEVFRMACHLPRINRPVVRFLRDEHMRSLVTPGFLEELGSDPSRDHSLDSAYRVRELVRLAGVRGLDRPPLLRSLTQLRDLHNEWAVFEGNGWRGSELIDWDTAEFPQPPVPGTLAIQPVRTAAALRAESEEMQHCAWTYAAEILQGGCYFYRVMSPERATLCIAPGAGESWKVREIRGPRNADVGGETHDAVSRWLRQPEADPRQLRLFEDRWFWPRTQPEIAG